MSARQIAMVVALLGSVAVGSEGHGYEGDMNFLGGRISSFAAWNEFVTETAVSDPSWIKKVRIVEGPPYQKNSLAGLGLSRLVVKDANFSGLHRSVWPNGEGGWWPKVYSRLGYVKIVRNITREVLERHPPVSRICSCASEVGPLPVESVGRLPILVNGTQVLDWLTDTEERTGFHQQSRLGFSGDVPLAPNEVSAGSGRQKQRDSEYTDNSSPSHHGPIQRGLGLAEIICGLLAGGWWVWHFAASGQLGDRLLFSVWRSLGLTLLTWAVSATLIWEGLSNLLDH